jgi:RNA polymerase primary sigma factor
MKCNPIDIDETVKSYFDGLKEFKPLSKKEERELLWKYKIGNDISARNKLINANLRYACKMASAYRNRGVSFSDLISEANMGLIEAIDKFDMSNDVKIISYSKWWIMQKMQAAIEKRNRMPESEIPEERDTPILDDDEDTAVENKKMTRDDSFIIETERCEDEREDLDFIEEILRTLSERESDMVNMYFGRCGYDENTLDEIGKKYKLTKERVRQIIEGAFRKLRTKSMLVDSKFLSR